MVSSPKTTPNSHSFGKRYNNLQHISIINAKTLSHRVFYFTNTNLTDLRDYLAYARD